MSKFLETYGVAIFTLVLVAILIAFAGPLGMKIKNATTDKVSQTEQIGKDEITVATGDTVRPAEPAEAVDKVYCIYYDDGEMTISQNKIETEAGRTVVAKGFYEKPVFCTDCMTTVTIKGAIKPKSCSEWFCSLDYGACSDLTEIKNIENLYTNECTSMSYMFSYCKSLTSLDISGFDTSKVTDMSNMFNNCKSLTSLDVSGFDTSKVTDMSDMFYDCNILTSLNVSNFDTSKVTNISNMFAHCCEVINLDVSGFDTSKVTDMADMFYECCNLTNLDVSGFDTSKVTDMSYMFDECSNLISLDLSGWNTENVTNMDYMFTNCDNLKSITATQTVKDKILKSYTRLPSGVTWIIK